MIAGDLHSGAVKLEQAMRVLRARWEQTRELWHDSTSRAFEDNHLADLEPHVKVVLEAAARLREVLDKAQQEVS
jgi:hypothetical protein